MGGEPNCKAVLFYGLRQEGVEEDVGDRCETETLDSAGVSSSWSLCSSASSLTDDEVTSPGGDHPPTASSPLDTTQLDGAGGPLYELSPLLAQLPVRTGLSKYYQGKSQSFTLLSDVTCVEDLAKKTPYIRRMKASSGNAEGLCAKRPPNLHHAPGPCSKTIAKKTSRDSSHCLLSRTRSTSLLHSSGKPPAYQSKKELYR